MDWEDAAVSDTSMPRPVIGLTRGLDAIEIEGLAVNAIRVHRQLLRKADQLFQLLPEEYQTGKSVGGKQHIEYIEAMLDMHSQMNVVDMLVRILGFIPSVPVDEPPQSPDRA